MKEMKGDISRVTGFAFASLGEETSGRKGSEETAREGNEQIQPGFRAWRIKDELKLEDLIA